jgi:transposase
MTTVVSLPVVGQALPAWRLRLHGDDFRQPPWRDTDRLALEPHLPPDLLRLARAIDRLVDRLCLEDLVASFFSTRGSPAHRPDLMLKAVLFFTQRGTHSPAEWARLCQDSLTARWLLHGVLPCRARWYAFRKRCRGFIDELNRQLLRLAIGEGLLDPEVAVIDGSFVAANSSRHVLLNGPRLRGRLQTLHAAIAADEAAAGSPSEAIAPGVIAAAAARPGWLAKTPAGRQRQRQSYLKAAAQLCQRLWRNRKRRKEDRKPDDKVLIGLGDPEAALGLDKEKVYRPLLLNVQLVSDLRTDFCIGYGVYASTQDAGTFAPMLTRVEYFTGRKLRQALADSGYASGANLREAEQRGVELLAPYQENDYSEKKAQCKQKQIPKSEFRWQAESRVYVCPEGKELSHVKSQTRQRGEQRQRQEYYRCAAEYCRACPRRGQCAKNPEVGRTVVRGEYEEEVQRQKERMSKEEAKRLYKKRKEQIERRIADGKEHRDLRKLSMRGLEGGNTQVGLLALANNLVTFDKRQHSALAGAAGGRTFSQPPAPPEPRPAPDKVFTLPSHLL